MWIDNTIFKEDLDRINRASFIDWAKFDGKTFFVTGGTGLIGYTFICALLYRNLIHHSRIHVIALVRGECKIVCVNRYCMNLLYAPYWGKQR